MKFNLWAFVTVALLFYMGPIYLHKSSYTRQALTQLSAAINNDTFFALEEFHIYIIELDEFLKSRKVNRTRYQVKFVPVDQTEERQAEEEHQDSEPQPIN